MLRDEVIGHFFIVVVPLHLPEYLPRIADFWEAIVFGTRYYSKNVMQVYQHIHALFPIKKEHLDRWVAFLPIPLMNTQTAKRRC